MSVSPSVYIFIHPNQPCFSVNPPSIFLFNHPSVIFIYPFFYLFVCPSSHQYSVSGSVNEILLIYISTSLPAFSPPGLADPSALSQAVSAFQACHFIGMPECEVGAPNQSEVVLQFSSHLTKIFCHLLSITLKRVCSS